LAPLGGQAWVANGSADWMIENEALKGEIAGSTTLRLDNHWQAAAR
jgi:hypothetical protein